jgi:hypothetical protein
VNIFVPLAKHQAQTVLRVEPTEVLPQDVYVQIVFTMMEVP